MESNSSTMITKISIFMDFYTNLLGTKPLVSLNFSLNDLYPTLLPQLCHFEAPLSEHEIVDASFYP
jgi:hypothetical protein